MSDRRKRLALGLLVAAATSLIAPADDGSVPLYTNTDLERFRGPETMDDADLPVAIATPEDGSWQFVHEFLAREYERLDADRENDLARRKLDIAERPERPRYTLPYYPYFWWRPDPIRRPIVPGAGHARMPRLDGRDAVPGPPDLRPSHGYDLPPARGRGRSGRGGGGGRGR